MKKIIASIIIVQFLFFPLVVFAQNIPLEIGIGDANSVSGLGQYLQVAYVFTVSSVGIIAAAMIMFNGIRWAAAAGNQEQIGKAKQGVINALVGLGLALGSWLILNTLNPALVDFTEPEVPGLQDQLARAANGDYSVPECSTDGQDAATGWKEISENNCGGVPVNPDSSWISGDWDLSKDEVADIINRNRGDLSATTIQAFMETESNFCPRAMSTFVLDDRNNDDPSDDIEGHACGVMQMLPSTASSLGSGCNVSHKNLDKDKWTPAHDEVCQELTDDANRAIICGIEYLQSLRRIEGGDEMKMAAHYNGGPQANNDSTQCEGQLNWQCTANTGWEETRGYVPKISANKSRICQETGGTVGQTTPDGGTSTP